MNCIYELGDRCNSENYVSLEKWTKLKLRKNFVSMKLSDKSNYKRWIFIKKIGNSFNNER